jgi:hypothetical protein
LFTRHSVRLFCLLILVFSLLLGCSTPFLIERDAQAAALKDPNWHLQWKDFAREEQTQTVVGRQVTVRAGSHFSLWARDLQNVVVVASTPELTIFGLDVNPIAALADQELAQFAIDRALTQASDAAGVALPRNPVLHREQEITMDAAYGQLSGTQFRVTAQEATVTVVILRARSGSDHIVVLGMLPHPLEQNDWNAFASAAQSSLHPVADVGEP